MGFLPPEPIERPHECARPGNERVLKEGTRWQCDECKKIYRLEPVRDRGITAPEWVLQPFRAVDLLL